MNKSLNKIYMWLAMIQLLWVSSIATSCKSPYDDPFTADYFEVEYKDRGVIQVPASGAEKVLRINTNISQDRWKASTLSDWITLEKGSDFVKVTVAPHPDFGARKGQVQVEYGHNIFVIPVEQTSSKKVLMEILDLDPEEPFFKTFSADGGEFKVQVRCNAPITDVVVPDSAAWMVLKSKQQTGDLLELTFSVESMDGVRDRYSSAYFFTSADISVSTMFTIKQRSRNYRLIPLTANMLSSNATQTNDGGGIPALVDNDLGTFFHSLWSSVAPGSKPHHLQIVLKEPISDLKVEYSSRPSGGGEGDVKRADIYYSDSDVDDDNAWTKAGTMTFNLPGGRRQKTLSNESVKFDNPVKYIRFVPTARRNQDPLDPTDKGKAWWNMGEIYLWTSSEV